MGCGRLRQWGCAGIGFDLDGGSLTIGRAKGGRTSTHTVARDDLSALRKMRKTTNGPWVFETERGGPLSVDAMQYIVREAGIVASLGDAIRGQRAVTELNGVCRHRHASSSSSAFASFRSGHRNLQ